MSENSQSQSSQDRFELPSDWEGQNIFITLGSTPEGKPVGTGGKFVRDLRGAIMLQSPQGQSQVWPKDLVNGPVILDTKVRLADASALSGPLVRP